MNLYEILGVSSDCSLDTLRQQYHRLLLEYHPDKSSSSSETRERFEAIQHAYRILSNNQLRFAYDQEQARRTLHNLAHTHIDKTEIDDGYTCRCGTLLEIENDLDFIECPNCSMRIEINQ